MGEDRKVTMKYKPYKDSDLLCNIHMKNSKYTGIDGYSLQEAIDTRDKLDKAIKKHQRGDKK